MIDHVVIVGAGQAAAHTAETLRRKGHAGHITLIGDEGELPYQRPPLSKKYLAGDLEHDRLLLRSRMHYDEHRIALRLDQRVEAIDRARRSVHLADGSSPQYDALVIATGSRPRRLELPGADLAGVHYLRNMRDAQRLRADLRPGAHAVVIGGGYIGLETAATLRHLGVEVRVLELAARTMNRAVAEVVSRFYEAEHRRHGVDIELGAGITAIQGDSQGRVRAVLGADGREWRADVVVVGVGVLPNDELARDAGLECANGILVDEFCRTADPAIYAIGDCSNHPSLHYGRRIRLESVDNAVEQANTVAANLTGTVTRHDRVPWFWSDQYHHKMLIVGLSQDHDRQVLRGSPADAAFSVCYLRDGELIAVDTVNQPRDQMAARKLVAARMRPDPAKLADPKIALKDCL
jgi:3-phenylpropionate/trans-cinnamate dioxygenase ferredoxin reductase subunit